MAVHVGINIYYWGEAEERRLLVDGVRLWVRAAKAEGLADRFWFCPFDARGPHIFAVFSAPAARRRRLLRFLRAEVEAFLRTTPSRSSLPPEELRRRHEACRGKTLCAADELDGIAANNTFEMFMHSPDRHPFWMAAGMTDPAGFWRELDRIALAALDRRADGTHAVAAIRWMAAVDRALERLGAAAVDYWRWHATTLIPSLAERFEDDRSDPVASLDHAIGERNGRLFRMLTRGPVDEAMDPGPAIERTLAEDGRPITQRFRVLRELNHTTFGQLGQPVRSQIPLILFAWRQRLVTTD